MPKHYLLSLVAPRLGGTMHCYLMSNDRADIQRATARLLDMAEKQFGDNVMPMVLATDLTREDAERVRAHIADRSAKIRKLLKKATDFHISVWSMASSDDDCRRLMELH